MFLNIYILNHRSMIKKIVYLLLIILAAKSVAQDRSSLYNMSLEELLRVKIASLQEQTVNNAPSSVSVITRSQIKKLGVTDLQSVLNFIPGFETTRDIEQGTADRISVRGRSTPLSESVLVLIDGQRLNDLYTGGISLLNRMLDIGLVEKIEIIRGPGSALYGSNAFLGVINIITSTKRNEVNLAINSFNGKRGSLLYSHSFASEHEIDLYFSSFDQSGDDYILTDINRVTQKTNDPIKGTDLYLKYRASQWLLTGRFMQRILDNFVVFGALGNNINHEKTNQVSVSADYSGSFSSDFKYNMRLSHSLNDWDTIALIIPRDIEVEPGFSLDEDFIGGPELSSQTTKLSFSANKRLNNQHQLSFGGAFEKAKITDVATTTTHDLATLNYLGGTTQLKDELSFNDKKTRKIKSLYIQEQFIPNEKFQITAGFRFDSYSDFGTSSSPRLAAVWKVDTNNSIKFLFATAFRAPNFLELYDRNNVVDFGNQNLNAEKVKTTEIAWLKSLNNVKFELTAFKNIFDDLIYLGEPVTSVNNPFNAPTFTNSPEEKSRGIETQVQWQTTDRLNIQLTASWVEDESIKNSLKTMSGLILNYDRDETHFNLSYYYRKTHNNLENLNSYGVANLNARRQLTDSSLLFLTVENLLDEKYKTVSSIFVDGIENRGRSIRLGLEISF